MIHRPIRSAAQRQILIWLRHGPSTVSEIAQQFSMRMPHASLACRQLREAGLITRDERGGLRNAPIYLSQPGHERLMEDAVGKMMQYADVLHELQDNLVLHADDANVLLAYTQPPKSSFVFVEDAIETAGGSSSGNKGGAWILAPTASVQWYNLDSGTPAEPPAPRETSTLAAFESSRSVFAMLQKSGGWTITTPLCLLDSRADLGRLDSHRLPFAAFSRTIRMIARSEELGNLPASLAQLTRRLLSEKFQQELTALPTWIGTETVILGDDGQPVGQVNASAQVQAEC